MTGVGIIGLGYWGPNLVRNFATADGAKLVAVADKDAGRLARIGRQYPAVAAMTSADELLDLPGVDLVGIATPVQTHHALAKRALEKGKHVLVEKPLTSNVAEAEELVDVAKKNGRVLMVDHTFVYHPAVEKISDVIKRGELGDLCYYDSVRINLGLFQQDISVVWDLAPHDVSIMQHLINRTAKWVLAVGARHAGQARETMAYLTVQYEDNILAHCHVNWYSPVKVRQVFIGGSKRMIVYDDNLVTEKVKIYDRGVELHSIDGIHQAMVQYRIGDMYAPSISTDEALRRMVQHLLHCIREGRSPLTDGAAGLRIVKILSAAQKSIESGQRQTLS
jgi:predicted dehydrogenase